MIKHWSVDTRNLRKDPSALAVWELENSINFGLREAKIKKSELLTHWDKLDIDPHKKKFLSLILHR